MRASATPAPVPARFVSLVYHDVHPGERFDYGRIGRSATDYHVPRSAFQRHLDIVRDSGLVPLDASSLAESLGGRGSAPGVGVHLSFDDGWHGALSIGVDSLASRGIPAHIFITTRFLGRPYFASAAMVRRLDPTLFTVGSHGATHRMLSSLSTNEIRAELAESRKTLEDLTGRAVTALSIPGGAVDARVVATARDLGYTSVFTSTISTNPTRDGALNVARLGVTRRTSDAVLGRWLRGHLAPEWSRKALLALPKHLLGMRTYSRVRRALLGESVGHAHVFEP